MKLSEVKKFFKIGSTYKYSYLYEKKKVEFKVEILDIKLKKPAWGNHHYNISLKCGNGYMDFKLYLDSFEILDKENHFVVKTNVCGHQVDFKWELIK